MLPVGGAELRRLAPHFAFYDIDPRRVRYLGTALWNDPTLAASQPCVAAPSRPSTQKAVELSKALPDGL